ncbi:hypothetical protein M407DRAFT_174500 [Tulasnella calospora MUT 4182]|uniref:Uncharacterized protein n=1 Tax=Tulasnella calospora MUT 4182 TaxID=1051891 RepID=A0A0C3L5B7_9AGAM|nr:hypothetical protein M407DRAFT_174500 [Tulasnella calospora MUT 4182]
MAAINESMPLLPPPAKSGITVNAKTALPVHIGTVGGYVGSAVVSVWLSSQAGLLDRFLTAFFTGFGSIDRNQMLASTALLYAFTTYVFTSANSIVGVALGSAGYHHDEPRHAKLFLTGLPYRLTASHQNLLEVFPIFALVAGLTAAQGPSSSLYHQGVTLLALHVFCKTIIFVPAYVKGLGVTRSAAHFIAIGALLGSLYQMTFSAQ